MYICTQYMLVTHMPMKPKGKNSDGRLQDEKTIRQVVVQLDYKKKKERETLTEPMFYLEKTDGKQAQACKTQRPPGDNEKVQTDEQVGVVGTVTKGGPDPASAKGSSSEAGT